MSFNVEFITQGLFQVKEDKQSVESTKEKTSAMEPKP